MSAGDTAYEFRAEAPDLRLVRLPRFPPILFGGWLRDHLGGRLHGATPEGRGEAWEPDEPQVAAVRKGEGMLFRRCSS